MIKAHYMKKITEKEKKIISEIQGDIDVDPRPFLRIAERLGLKEDEVIKTIRDLKDRGVLRRFGATIRHQISGFRANAMVAWKVEDGRVEEVGNLFSSLKEVTHCYERKTPKDWPYNLFTMIHAKTEEECIELARRMSKKVNITDYILLFSDRELKKVSMEYF